LPIQIDHQLGHPCLGRGDAAPVFGQAEFTQQRGLKAVAVQKLALDPGGHQRLVADQLDRQRPLLGVTQMGEGPEQESGFVQQARLQGREPHAVVGECGPIGLLPVPDHEA